MLKDNALDLEKQIAELKHKIKEQEANMVDVQDVTSI